MSRPAPFTVMTTIHGPDGWHDGVDTKCGHTVAGCPRKCFAEPIAAALHDYVLPKPRATKPWRRKDRT